MKEWEAGREGGREGGREEGGEGEKKVMFHESCEHFLCRTGGNQHASVSGSLGGACQTEGDGPMIHLVGAQCHDLIILLQEVQKTERQNRKLREELKALQVCQFSLSSPLSLPPLSLLSPV